MKGGEKGGEKIDALCLDVRDKVGYLKHGNMKPSSFG